jgi:hypothetical protein
MSSPLKVLICMLSDKIFLINQPIMTISFPEFKEPSLFRHFAIIPSLTVYCHHIIDTCCPIYSFFSLNGTGAYVKQKLKEKQNVNAAIRYFLRKEFHDYHMYRLPMLGTRCYRQTRIWMCTLIYQRCCLYFDIHQER